MSTLTRLLHFHEGTPGERAVKVSAAFLAALALVTIAGSMTRITARATVPGTPIITDVRVTIRDGVATFSWTTDVPAIGGVVWGTDSQETRRLAGVAPMHVAPCRPPARTSCTATITNLTPGTYAAYVEATAGADAWGNERRSRSPERTFRVP